MEKLHRITKRIVAGENLDRGGALAWRERYCADLRTRTLHGPEDYFGIPPEYRLWIWPRDLNQAVSRLDLVPRLPWSAPPSQRVAARGPPERLLPACRRRCSGSARQHRQRPQ